ncbi:MAG: glycoside hydrolase family 65 protein [Muribaculaceae bacterium]|nr:glycoside hydrolase family 65 protein [Muribaculaceae bacterium]
MRYYFILILAFCLFHSHAQFKSDEWNIVADSIDTTDYYGVTVANGMLGLLSSPEPLKTECVVLAGSYDKYGRGGVSNFLNGFNMLNTSLAVNGKTINRNNISDFKQCLNMKEAMHCSSFNYTDKAKVNYSYLALRQAPYCALLVIEIEALDDITIDVRNNQATPVSFRNGTKLYNEITRRHANIQLLSTEALSPTGKLKVCATSSFMFPEEVNMKPRVIHSTSNNDSHTMRFSRSIAKGEKYRFAVVGSTITSAHNPDPMNEAERLTIFASLEGIDRLLSIHKSKWNELWQSDIIIDGDNQAQQDVHNMIYHLYSFVREGSRLSISPMGLSGLGYNGHIFWDADTWIFPALLMLQPKLAKSLIDYRSDRLKAAKQNAYEHGYAGAMYPWESAETGFEETPVWALAGTFEHHISACVGNAAWLYYKATQDLEWLRNEGYPIIAATADFWISRSERGDDGKFHIRNVVAADEYAENVDDNAYTNGAAKINMLAAYAASKLLKISPNESWKTVADNLAFLKLDDGTTGEHASYNGQKIKQADVNLLAYPLALITDKAQILKDLEYYQEKVPVKNTPAMTQAIFSLLYSRLGQSDKAYYYFCDAYIPNRNKPFGVIAETKGGTNPYFITGAGGVLQTIMMGFCGLEITDKGITQIKSTIPSNWKSITLKGIGLKSQQFQAVNH